MPLLTKKSLNPGMFLTLQLAHSLLIDGFCSPMVHSEPLNKSPSAVPYCPYAGNKVNKKKNTKTAVFVILFGMFKIGNVTFHFNKVMVFSLIILGVLLFFPLRLEIAGVNLINIFVKERLLAIGILFLVLRSIIHEYYATNLALLFLVILFLSATFSFAHLVVLTLVSIAFLNSLKKM